MKTLLILFFVSIIFSSESQLVTYTHPTPVIGLGQGDFLGANYDVISTSYNGHFYSLAHFDATNTTLGVNKGILLTTGVVIDNGYGPHGPNDLNGCTTSLNILSDNTITDLYFSQANAFDMARLEIEFVPNVDSLKIKFVFASEEYPTILNSPYNDFFVVRLFKNDTTLISNNIAGLPTGKLYV